MSDARIDARIEMAARVLCRRGALSRAPFDLAEEMLAVADATEASECEKLRAALRALVEAVVDPTNPATWSGGVLQERIDRARALVGSAPQTPNGG